MRNQPASPKMSKAQARLFWNSLTPQQRADFNKLLEKMGKKELMMTYVGVDDNEQIQHVVLEPKDKPSKPDKPFYEHFKLD